MLLFSNTKVVKNHLLPNYPPWAAHRCLSIKLLVKSKYVFIMATNGKTGDGHRDGAVRERSQFQHPDNGHWYKRDTNTGHIIDVNKGGQPHKGVRKEK